MGRLRACPQTSRRWAVVGRGVLAGAAPPTLTFACGGAHAMAADRPLGAEVGASVTAPACPSDAMRDRSGRCACVAGQVPLLGSCVSSAVADAFCAPAARWTPDGCSPRPCPSGQLIDLARGECLADIPAVEPDGADASTCGPESVRAFENARLVCVARDAACPRGTTREEDACLRAPPCPPGTLAAIVGADASCRSVVHAGSGAEAGPIVDVGAWAALMFGADGGPGSSELCRPLQARPTLFAPREPDDTGPLERSLRIRIALRIPNNDVSRVVANAAGTWTARPGRPAPPTLSADADAAVANAVQTLLELLRGLGGVASAASAELDVRCVIPVTRETHSNLGSHDATLSSCFGAGSSPAGGLLFRGSQAPLP